MNVLDSLGFWPVAFDELEPFRGLNSKTAKVDRSLSDGRVSLLTSRLLSKSIVSSLEHGASQARLKLLELERAVSDQRLPRFPQKLINIYRNHQNESLTRKLPPSDVLVGSPEVCQSSGSALAHADRGYYL